jgi:hypothetical protein
MVVVGTAQYLYYSSVTNIVTKEEADSSHNVAKKHKSSIHEELPNDNVNDTTTSKQLEFIHIPKTGGTAIESLAAMHGIRWGACHYEKSVGGEQLKPGVLQIIHEGTGACPPDPDLEGESKQALDWKVIPIAFGWPRENWHIPPHWKKPNPLEGKATFAVVRNPYTLLISHFNCRYKGRKGTEEEMHDAKVMNKWIRDLLTSERMNSAHFLLQHYFIYNINDRKVVDHVLKFENLASEFNQLMAVYNMNLSMDEVSKVNPSKFEPLGTKDLDDETISLINEVYYLDFVYFNYSLVQPSTNKELFKNGGKI